MRATTISIPITVPPQNPDRKLIKGPYAGQPCYYKTALLNTLIYLKPKICLEIGTFKGESAKIFQHYFENYEPNGILFTLDIKLYSKNLKNQYIHPIQIYPHITNSQKYHYVTDNDLLPNTPNITDSLKENLKIMKAHLKKQNLKKVDFCFIDGDHTRTSFLKDFRFCKLLTHSPRWILIDDVKEHYHECSTVYEQEIKPHYTTYEFNDWPVLVGMGLVT